MTPALLFPRTSLAGLAARFACIFLAAGLTSFDTAQAAPGFPLELIGSECYVFPDGSGGCSESMRFVLKDNGKATSDSWSGIWAYFSDTFTMTLVADYDGDGRPDARKDYVGHKSPGGCVTGDVRSSDIRVIGRFELCPR